jgi:hypothetical protein
MYPDVLAMYLRKFSKLCGTATPHFRSELHMGYRSKEKSQVTYAGIDSC